jgi:prepilin-type N-terminal cleavage/methylation domain-containing protein
MNSIKFLKRGFTLLEIMIVVMILGILLGIAVPQFLDARTNSRLSSCLSNLREIESAKDIWAQQTGQAPTATPAQADLVPGFMQAFPTCPAAGVYTIGNLLTNPSCTIAGHVLP